MTVEEFVFSRSRSTDSISLRWFEKFSFNKITIKLTRPRIFYFLLKVFEEYLIHIVTMTVSNGGFILIIKLR